jgi:hypothetical protein
MFAFYRPASLTSSAFCLFFFLLLPSLDMEAAQVVPRASLFIASRLACTVQKFKDRLKEKVRQKKRGPNPFGNSYLRGIRLRALSDLERFAIPRDEWLYYGC